jgi:hypothetical protein
VILPSDQLADAVADAVADALADILPASVEVTYNPGLTFTVRLDERVARLASRERNSLTELLDAVPAAGVEVVRRLPQGPSDATGSRLDSALRRGLRDMVAAEVLVRYARARLGRPVGVDLVADTIGFLIELSGTRVESHNLTHGVVISDVLRDVPRLEFAYPADVRAAKRAPLLFDGQRAVLVVDPEGRARTELQRHRLCRLSEVGDTNAEDEDDLVESGSLVAEATRLVGGLGFFLRADRSIWTFVDGLPLLVRRSEHWTAFPLELTASIENMIGGGNVAGLVARAAFMISARPQGAILAIVDDPADLKGIVPPKDRYDQRAAIGREEMRPETRLHHLIDAEQLDDETLVRLAELDGATVLDREGRLLAYGAIVSSADSEHEGARTAAAKTLSQHARVVLKVSVDGDITIFRHGVAVTTLLGRVTDLRDEINGAGEGTVPPAG